MVDLKIKKQEEIGMNILSEKSLIGGEMHYWQMEKILYAIKKLWKEVDFSSLEEMKMKLSSQLSRGSISSEDVKIECYAITCEANSIILHYLTDMHRETMIDHKAAWSKEELNEFIEIEKEIKKMWTWLDGWRAKEIGKSGLRIRNKLTEMLELKLLIAKNEKEAKEREKTELIARVVDLAGKEKNIQKNKREVFEIMVLQLQLFAEDLEKNLEALKIFVPAAEEWYEKCKSQLCK